MGTAAKAFLLGAGSVVVGILWGLCSKKNNLREICARMAHELVMNGAASWNDNCWMSFADCFPRLEKEDGDLLIDMMAKESGLSTKAVTDIFGLAVVKGIRLKHPEVFN